MTQTPEGARFDAPARAARIAARAPWISVVAFVGFWFVCAERHIIDYLPSPTAVLFTMGHDWHALLVDALATSSRAIVGFLIGAPVGVFLALAMAWRPGIRDFLDPLVRGLRPVPLLALIPLFILWFGLSEAGRVLFVATGCLFLTVVIAIEAIHNVPQIYLRSGSSLGAKEFDLYRRVVLPAILPGIFGGARVALTTSFQLTIAAEFLGAQTGLGFYLTQGAVAYRMSEMIAAVVIVSLLAVAADVAARRGGGVLMPWVD